ncbi:EG45-like domain containing protein [Dendrobium catenatum]|uniref:EG45-like domain containing protein n=1 Tax=Dendrobium catenatum TaxID=906689 RepID=A0A2I0WHX2_9ASPA|nr:EG45-like domain containing protein [Dendrobium catenatum]PKU75259.1 EG45-like domain containing protein [Dendrobium catenatum]
MDQKRNNVIVVVAVLAMLCSLSLVFAVETEATYGYLSHTQSECFGSKDKGTLIAAVGHSIWNNKAICGHKLKVRCINGGDSQSCKSSSVTVEVVDLCKGCDDSIVLSEEAFDIIASIDVGRVKVEYEL